MTTLIIVAVLAVAAWITTKYLAMRREFKLRHAPRGKKALVEILLPRDVKNANEQQARFYKMAAGLTVSDGPERLKGEGQICILIYAHRAVGKLVPTLQFLIECDADQLPRLKKAINTSFDGDAAIVSIPKHPLAPIEKALLARDARDGKGMHQVEGDRSA